MTEGEDKHEVEPDRKPGEPDPDLLALGWVHDKERQKSGETLVSFLGPEGTKAMSKRFGKGEGGDGKTLEEEDPEASEEVEQPQGKLGPLGQRQDLIEPGMTETALRAAGVPIDVPFEFGIATEPPRSEEGVGDDPNWKYDQEAFRQKVVLVESAADRDLQPPKGWKKGERGQWVRDDPDPAEVPNQQPGSAESD